MVAFHNGILVYIPPEQAGLKNNSISITMKVSCSSGKYENEIKQSHPFCNRLSNLIEIENITSDVKLSLYVGFSKQALIIDTSRHFYHEYVTFMRKCVETQGWGQSPSVRKSNVFLSCFCNLIVFFLKILIIIFNILINFQDSNHNNNF